jgi:hypothetical protein
MTTIQTQANDRDLVLISVFTFFTVSLWIVFEVLKTIKTTTVTSSTAQIVVPLSPKIDTQTVTLLESKKMY